MSRTTITTTASGCSRKISLTTLMHQLLTHNFTTATPRLHLLAFRFTAQLLLRFVHHDWFESCASHNGDSRFDNQSNSVYSGNKAAGAFFWMARRCSTQMLTETPLESRVSNRPIMMPGKMELYPLHISFGETFHSKE